MNKKKTITKEKKNAKVEKNVKEEKIIKEETSKKSKSKNFKLDKKNIAIVAIIVILVIAIMIVGKIAIGLKKTVLILGGVLLLALILKLVSKIKKKENKKETKSEKTNDNIKHKKLKIFLIIVFCFGIICFAGIAIFMYAIVKSANPKYDVKKLYNQESSIIYDRNGKVIAELAFEKREIITYEEMPEVLINAIIATEDSRFFQHNGFDALRFTKASIGQILGHDSGGASTLTMQISKNRFTSNEASGLEGIIRKFQDIYLSVFKLERDYTKKELIELYANSFYLGGSSYGVEQACQTYFGKSAKDITLAEAAMIAGLYQSPSEYDPFINPDKTENRRQTVLYLMELHGYITKEEREIASKLSVKTLLANKQKKDSKQYLAFINTVISEVKRRTGLDIYSTPMHVYSTMDPTQQEYLDRLMYTDEIIKWPNEMADAGIVILETGTAEITSIAAGRNTVGLGYNNATDINRQIGSTAKPLYDYGPAIEYNNISTYNLIADEPYSYSNGVKINNFDFAYNNLMTTRNAIKESKNVPALKTFKSVDRSKIKEFVKKLHLHPEADLHEAHSVGGYNGESPLSLAGAYNAIADGGYYVEPHSIRKIYYLETGQDFEVTVPKEKVMNASTSFMLTNMLVTTANYILTGSNSVKATIAAKTGTTDLSPATIKAYNFPSKVVNDKWLAGFNSDYVMTLWYGYKELNSKYYSTRNTTTNKAIFSKIGNQIWKGNKLVSQPKNVVKVAVEKDSYPAKLPSEYTPSNYILYEYFINGTQPNQVSTRFSRLNNVSNLNAVTSGGKVTLSWTSINTPDALNEQVLRESYKPLFTNSAQFDKFIAGRLESERNLLGNVGYRIYIKNYDGSLESIGYTYGTSFTYNISNIHDITFVVQTEYDIFNSNASSGAEVSIYSSNFGNNAVSYLNGKSEETIGIGQQYYEPSPAVIVTDSMEDVTIKATISKEIKMYNSNVIVSNIDTSKEGKYVIEYHVKYGAHENTLKRYITVQ